MTDQAQSSRRGVVFALCAYFIWGFAPLYFKLLEAVPAWEILSHRVIWSLLFSSLLVGMLGLWPTIRQVLSDKKRRRLLVASSLLIGTNWGVFIWAITHEHMLDASLGYFINPLINVILGMLFLGERLRPWQWLAVALAALGVGMEILHFGQLPWVALVLACSFGFYGLVRKKVMVDATSGMFLETVVLLPLAIGYLLLADTPSSDLLTNSWDLNLLLVAAGPVTMVPLMCFAAAATKLKLSTLGFFQYIGPSLMFLLAVLHFGEAFDAGKLITFVCIWGALVVFSVDGIRSSAGKLKVVEAEAESCNSRS